ncbi:hypothetical protein JCGZ_17053 [Jatropha curcas]|uniref:Phytocyanin domain-containing protein n=1 Tax=Jatropha curcas TaxID=180498 RepID=A0A067K245_JATCU|nr:umecyanin [Jatropha curcas]KDP30271.1 hypothetical protein JCGZ_17053 [Jatropha curcas]
MGIRVDWIRYLIFSLALLETVTANTTYTVGDAMGWRVPTDTSFYDDWVANKTFLPGDELVFNWTSAHNVLEVTSKEEYDDCTKTNGIPNETSPVTVSLPKNNTRYFICTIGTHCSGGQKVTIKVGNGVSSNSANTALPSLLLFASVIIYLFSFSL